MNATVKLYINGFLDRLIEVRCGVRQGDPISCPLFVTAIESLAQLITKDPRI